MTFKLLLWQGSLYILLTAGGVPRTLDMGLVQVVGDADASLLFFSIDARHQIWVKRKIILSERSYYQQQHWLQRATFSAPSYSVATPASPSPTQYSHPPTRI